jgi:thiamine biosynthesis protein ThiS
MQVIVNGKPREVPEGVTVAGLLEALQIDPLRVAVQRNLEIVKREQYAQTALAPGDRVEIITFMAGGCA